MTSSNGRNTSKPLSLETEIVARSENISCDLADEAVVLNSEEGVYYGLNPVASRVWALAQAPRTLRDIRDALLEEFFVENEKCTRDLFDLIGTMLEQNLVELRNVKPIVTD